MICACVIANKLPFKFPKFYSIFTQCYEGTLLVHCYCVSQSIGGIKPVLQCKRDMHTSWTMQLSTGPNRPSEHHISKLQT